MRLDEALKNQGLVSSREKAKSLILSGHAKVNGEIIKKPSTLVTNEALVVSKTLYVSRSAEKLREAMNRWDLDLNDQVVLDIGASTGGFTQVALEKGARSVLALDVGSNQLDHLLLNDSRVINLENIHFLKTNRSDFAALNTTLIDVSFISSLKILSHALTVLDCSQYLVLFKPQFEMDAPQKDHIVKEKKRLALKSAWFEAVKAMGFHILESCDVTPGKKGNQETMVYLQVK
jgi:23S rRNA (cytidine1920-2'-O)/16S rRNA (cytidine1409-2'-O)-methyltransferase